MTAPDVPPAQPAEPAAPVTAAPAEPVEAPATAACPPSTVPLEGASPAPVSEPAAPGAAEPAPAPLAPVVLAYPPGEPPEEPFRQRLIAVLVLAAVACLAVFHGWRKDHLLAPTDALYTVAPWETPGRHEPARNEQLLDQTVQFVPWMIYTTSRLKDGDIPLWNPHCGLGAPFLANGQSAVFYPTTLLHLGLPETWSWTLGAALRLFLAGLGAWVLARRYGLRGAPRLLAGLAFMLCGFNIVWLNHPQMNVMPLLPWAVLCVEMLVERVTLLRFLGVTGVLAIQFLGGHPSSTAHLLVTCGLVLLARLVVPADDGRPEQVRLRWLGGAAAFTGGLGLAFALAAVQWLPLIEYANHSGARIVRQENLASERVIALSPSYALGLVFPYANGYAPDRVTPFDLRRVTGLPNTNELAAGFVGTVPLLLAVLGALQLRRRSEAPPARRRAAGFWLAVGAVALLVGIKFPGVDHIVRLVPVLNVSQNARMLVVTALALAMLSGMGLEAFLGALRSGQDHARLRRVLTRIACALAGVALLGLLALWAFKTPILNKGVAKAEEEYKKLPYHEHSLDYVRDVVRRVHAEAMLTSARLLIPAGMLGAAAALLLLARRARNDAAYLPAAAGTEGPGGTGPSGDPVPLPAPGQSGDWLGGAAASAWPWIGLALIDLLAFAIPYNPGAPRATYFPAAPAIEYLQQSERHRFAGTFRTFMPETATAYGLNDLRGYDALAPERYYKWWAHEGIGDLRPELQGYLSRLETPDHPAWRLLNFGYFVQAPDQPAPPAEHWAPAFESPGGVIYKAKVVRPRAWVVPKAENLASIEQVLDRVAKMDFDPDKVVLVDGAPPALAARPEGSAAGARVTPVPPRLPTDHERPERIRLRVSGAPGGWLVMSDAFTPGWRAVVTDESTGIGSEVDVLPAYGALRAVPLPLTARGNVLVELDYRPASFRYGLMVSGLAAAVVLVLVGFALFPAGRAKAC